MRMSGYGRVSTDEEKQLDSLAHQLEFFAEFAKKNGHTLYKVYADEGISGKQLKNRVEFQRMLQDAEFGLFDLVVVKDVSRFARNTVDLLVSIRKLKSLGVEVIFVNNSQKILGESEFVITLLGAMAQEESANLSKRVKFGKDINSKKGRVPPRIYGYDRIDNFTLAINETEADIVRRIFSLYIDQGLGCRLIATELERQNALTKCGGKWNSRGVRRILENPIYCGRYFNHKYTVTDFLEGTREKLPPDQFYEHMRPEWRIISEDRFEEAAKVLVERRRQYQTNFTSYTGRYSGRHLFSTLIRCQHCGRAFTRRVVKYTNSEYIFWRCPTNNEYTAVRCPNNTIIREDELKRKLSEYLSGIITDKDKLARKLVREYEKAHQSLQVLELTTNELEGKKARLQKQLDKYAEMYANDVISMDTLKAKTSSVKDEILEIDNKLLRSKAKESSRHDIDTMIQDAMDEIDKFLSLENATNVDLRKIVSSISVSVNREVSIYLKISETVAAQRL